MKTKRVPLRKLQLMNEYLFYRDRKSSAEVAITSIERGTFKLREARHKILLQGVDQELLTSISDVVSETNTAVIFAKDAVREDIVDREPLEPLMSQPYLELRSRVKTSEVTLRILIRRLEEAMSTYSRVLDKVESSLDVSIRLHDAGRGEEEVVSPESPKEASR